MTGRAPWPVMIVAGVVILAGMATLGALWSGSEAGQAFAQAATSTYESSWLPWAGALVAVGCGIGLLLGWWMARWILLFWMAYGAVESLALLDEPHVNLPVLGAYDDPKLPAGELDLIIMVDVYHEFSQPQRMLQRMHEALKPGGRLALFEYRAEDPNVPILPLHKMSKAQVKTEVELEGFKQQRVFDDLPWQHLIVFTRP